MSMEIYGLAEAAKYLQKHPKTMQRYDREGILPAHRTKTGVRFWLKKDLDAFLGLEEDDGSICSSQRDK